MRKRPLTPAQDELVKRSAKHMEAATARAQELLKLLQIADGSPDSHSAMALFMIGADIGRQLGHSQAITAGAAASCVDFVYFAGREHDKKKGGET